MISLNFGRVLVRGWLARAYLGFLEAEAAEADEVEYLPLLGDVGGWGGRWAPAA